MSDRPLITVDDYESAAKAVLPRMAYDYYRSGADDERTLKANRKAFKLWEIHYRVLVDVSTVDTSATVLGAKVEAPILVAPTAYQRLADPGGEVTTAQGAAQAGAVFILSTLATRSIEDVAAASPGPKWFQLYVHKDRGLTKSLVERAEAAGYGAIVLTVDAPVMGRRIADERNEFALPPGMAMANLVGSAEVMAESAGAGGSALAAYVAARHDASVTWDDLGWLRSITSLPLVIKGIVRADDARRAADAGAVGIVVSNHGGRQLDSSPPTIAVLPEIADAVAGDCEVLVDGGFRSGTDILKALGLGARAVLVGRPALWGLAVAGAEGVAAVLHLLRDELTRAMTLAGCPNVASIGRDLIKPSSLKGK
jgi:4-hydroxymandelate oxidase